MTSLYKYKQHITLLVFSLFVVGGVLLIQIHLLDLDWRTLFKQIVYVYILGCAFVFVLSIWVVSKLVGHQVESIYRIRHTIDDGNSLNKFSHVHISESNTENEARKYRREFIGNISHELKTPIFNIQGYIDILLDGASKDEERQERYLNKTAQNAERLANIVDDLLIISRYESGKLDLNIERVHLTELIRQVYLDVEVQADKKGILLSIDADPNEDIYVYVDRIQMQLVFNNLVYNSIKYGKTNGRTIIQLQSLDAHVLVQVIDNGMGIKEKHLSRLFERFYRIDKGRSRSDGGTGLGLSIVKHILDGHKQKIEVESKIGVGTIFTFMLKLSK